MATYKVSGTAKEIGVAAAQHIVVYKADRSSPSTMGEKLGMSVAVGGAWQVLYEDWGEEVCIVCLDSTPAVKYKAKVKDWVVGILVGAGAGIPALPPNYDEYLSSTVVRMHADTNILVAGSGFDNIPQNAWTAQGGATVSAVQKKFGASSMYFDGVDDSFTLQVAADSDRVIPDTPVGPFCVEAWVYPTIGTGDRTIAAQYLSADSGRLLLQLKTGKLYAFHGQGLDVLGTATIATNAWTHVAFSFDGSSQIKGYVNGVLDFTGDWSAATGFADSWFTVGARHNGSSVYADFFQGYIDEVRVTRTHRYPTAFSVPIFRPSNFGKSGANSIGSLPTNYVVNGNAETGTLSGWTAGVGTTVVAVGGGASMFGSYGFSGSGSASSSNYQWLTLPAAVHTVRASFWQNVGADNDNAAVLVEWFLADQTTEVGTELLVSNPVGLAGTGDIRYLTGTATKPPTAVWAKVWMLFNQANSPINTALDEYVIQFNPEPEHYWQYPEPLAANVVSRLNFLEPDGSAYTVDRATVPLTWAFVGAGTVQSYNSPFSDTTNSYRCVGDGSYIYTDGLPGIFNAVTAKVCVRFWVKVNNIASGLVEPFLFMGTTTSDSNRLFLGIISTGQIQLYANLGGSVQLDRLVTASTFMTSGQWHHITLQKSNYHLELFIDGKYVTGGPLNSTLTLGTRFCLGMMRAGAAIHGLNGNIADVQILTNVAPHVTEFAPPPWVLPIP